MTLAATARRTITAALALAALAACTAPPEPTATTTPPPTASATATPTPGLTDEQRIVVSVWEAWQRELAVASCMADRGFAWTPEPYSAEPGFDPFLAQLGIDGEAWRAAAEARADAAFATNATYRDALDADARNAYTLARWGLTWASWLTEGGEIADEDNCDAAAWAEVGTVWRSAADRPDHYRALIAHIPTDDAFIAYLRGVAGA